jgi:hypothetical protein
VSVSSSFWLKLGVGVTDQHVVCVSIFVPGDPHLEVLWKKSQPRVLGYLTDSLMDEFGLTSVRLFLEAPAIHSIPLRFSVLFFRLSPVFFLGAALQLNRIPVQIPTILADRITEQVLLCHHSTPSSVAGADASRRRAARCGGSGAGLRGGWDGGRK